MKGVTNMILWDLLQATNGIEFITIEGKEKNEPGYMPAFSGDVHDVPYSRLVCDVDSIAVDGDTALKVSVSYE